MKLLWPLLIAIILGAVAILVSMLVTVQAVGFETKTDEDGQKTVIGIFDVRNNTPFDLEFTGYDRQEPLIAVDHQKGNLWRTHFRPWCGFGTRDFSLDAWEKIRCRFPIGPPDEIELGRYRFGFIWRFKSRWQFVNQTYFTDWSGPLAVEPH